MSDERAYPLPRTETDPRFNMGLTIDVIKVLEDHGYPAIHQGGDVVRLQEALFGFLYGQEAQQ